MSMRKKEKRIIGNHPSNSSKYASVVTYFRTEEQIEESLLIAIEERRLIENLKKYGYNLKPLTSCPYK